MASSTNKIKQQFTTRAVTCWFVIYKQKVTEVYKLNTWHHANQNSTKATPHIMILLMEEILHQSMGSVSHYSGQVFYTSQVVQDIFHQHYMGWACSEPKQCRSRNHLTQRWVHGDRNDGRPGMAEALVWLPAIAHLGACGSPFIPTSQNWREPILYQKWSSKKWHSKVASILFNLPMYNVYHFWKGGSQNCMIWMNWWQTTRSIQGFKGAKVTKLKLLAMIFLLCETLGSVPKR